MELVSVGSYKPLRRLPSAVRSDRRNLLRAPAAALLAITSSLLALGGYSLARLRLGRLVAGIPAKLEAGEG